MHGGDKPIGVPIPRGERPWLVTDSGGHSAPVRAAFFHPNGDNLITVSADKTVRLWDLGSGEMMHVFRLPVGPGIEGALQAGDISPDGRVLAVGGATVGNGKFGSLIYLINIENNQVERTMPGHKDNIVHLAFSHDGATLASASRDGTARLYDPKTGQALRVLKGHTQPLRKLAFSHDDKYLATTDVDRSVRIWSVADGETVAVLKDFPKDVITVAWHPKEHLLATSSRTAIQIWKTDGTRIKNARLDPADVIQVVSMAFSPDGNELLYGGVSYSGRVGMFNLKDDKIRVAFTKHTNTVLDARFSPDAKLAITTGGDNHETYVWKPADGTVVQKLQGASQSVWSVGWRLDGKAFGWGHTNGGPRLPPRTVFCHRRNAVRS